eukprot:GHVH01012808.1.p1 GENE.GHVH01012808.1~~GHVH01012808.1.p1  ORF type:complete len:189 (+),score=22.23 GHVH01012808.1:81-647(+)
MAPSKVKPDGYEGMEICLHYFVAHDPSPIVRDDVDLQARDRCQLLVNQMFTSLEREVSSDGVFLKTDHPGNRVYQLPRADPIPSQDGLTRWQQFAKVRGIKSNAKRSRLQMDEATGVLAPRYGKGSHKKLNEQEAFVMKESEVKKMDLRQGENPFSHKKNSEAKNATKQQFQQFRNKAENLKKKTNRF